MKNRSILQKMEALINPKSIAIIGASETTMYGKGILDALMENHYEGRIFPVNPKRDEVLGIKCYRSLTAIEDPVDLVIVIIGRKYVLKTLEECVEKNVKGVLIITAGFAEADKQGKDLERQIKQYAADNALPVWGPNCAGFANFKNGVIATLLREEGRGFLPGKAGFVSQSGALMMSLVGVARDKGLGLNYALSTGNEVDLESADFIEYMLQEPSNKVVGAFIEGFKDVGHFLRVADMALEKGKPLCILKVGRSKLGERAAASHTGSITGSDNAYQAIFRQKGVIRVVDTDELMDIAKLCSVTKWPESEDIAIITSSGGTGSLSADLCADYNLNLPDMSQGTKKKLAELEELLTFESLSNPIDVRGQGIRALDKVLPIVISDPSYGMVVITISFSSVGANANNVATIVRDAILSAKSDKPVFVLWMGRRQRFGGLYEVQEGFEILERAEIPAFSEPLKCFKSIRKIVDFTRAQKEFLEKQKKPAASKPETHLKEVKKIVDATNGALVESDSKKILSLYDVPITREQLAHTAEHAVRIADEIGYPVALKVMSPEILHKTDANVIQLGIRDSSAVNKAYETIIMNANAYDKDAAIRGVLVQEMVSPGTEVILGMKRDLQFGPLLIFGLGGIFVEVFKDVSFRFPPISEKDAYEMIKETKGYKILMGARGKEEHDIEALVDIIVKFSFLCVDTAGIFTEIDVNPLIVGEKGKGVKVVDSLMVL